jgi:predicted transcriptional regulator
VRHGSKLSYDELQQEAREALQKSEYTQQEMADRLDVTRPSIAKAVTQPGPKFQRLQMRIIEALTEYNMVREETVRFRVSRKDQTDE